MGEGAQTRHGPTKFLTLFLQIRTTPTVAFIALVTLWCATIIPMADALSGFSNKSMLAVGVLFVVVSSIERSQLVPWAARVVLGTKTSELPLFPSPPLLI